MNGRKSFSRQIKRIVFKNSNPTEGNPTIWRRDIDNKLICFPSYGDRNSSYGWDIHHIDGNPNNNEVENLIAVHYDTHGNFHI